MFLSLSQHKYNHAARTIIKFTWFIIELNKFKDMGTFSPIPMICMNIKPESSSFSFHQKIYHHLLI